MLKKIIPLVVCLMLPLITAASPAPLHHPSSYEPIIRDNFQAVRNVVVAIAVEFVSKKDPPAPPEKTIGSGIIIHPDGIIFTNAHVLSEKDFAIKNITVELWDGNVFFTKDVQWIDTKTDTARIKVDAVFTHYAKIDARNFDAIRQEDIVGEKVIIMGHPFGLSWDIVEGYITHPSRILTEDNANSFIQLELHVNPGNSGGGLFDSQGELIGVPTMMIDGSGKGFAIPIKRFCDKDKEHGYNACVQTRPEKAIKAPEHTPLFPSAPSIQ
ncbi:MAG: trypsin-like peptidase domain-containing protein [bacterium]|nr:trypsin-like peptidase domain-containing protein [bacterium]